jgi:hypothetical protein
MTHKTETIIELLAWLWVAVALGAYLAQFRHIAANLLRSLMP